MDSEKAKDVRKNFRWMTYCFAVNHSCATAPLIFASSLLDKDCGYFGNGILYALSVVSSLLVAVPAVDAIGLKGGLLCGTFLYVLYVGCFTMALFCKDVLALQYVFFTVGSTACGLAAGILWTAEGGYMAHSATRLAELGAIKEDMTAELSGDFAFYYLIAEVFGKLAFSFLQGWGFQASTIGALYTLIAFVAMCLLSRIDASIGAEDSARDGVRKPVLGKLFATVRLWKDPRVWLLSPTNITFGFAAAYLNGYFNATYEAPELGVDKLGLLAAITVGCAAGLSKVYGLLGTACGKWLPITIGALSFAGIPILVLILGCCKGFGWSMVIFYILQGSGRAVYESTNKAVFSDFFTSEETEGAFANCAMQMSVSSAFLFFNSGKFSGQQLATMVMVSALLTPPVYALASFFKGKEADQFIRPDAESQAILEDEGLTARE